MAEEKQWPFTFQCGRIQGTAKKTKNPEWTLHQGKDSRLWKKRINFDQSFQQTPAVVTGLSLLDIVTDDDIRANVEADNISADGFDIKITTWGDTKLWSITATWFAYEKIPASVQGTMLHSGRLAFNRKLKGYDLDEGSQERSIVQSVKYPVKFNTTPNVVLGFCLVDHLNDADCRMKVKAENVTNQGFDVRLTTWSDSHVWSSSVCWIAVDGALTRSAGGRIQTGQHLFKQTHPGYQLHKGEGSRVLAEHIIFAKPFTSHVKKENIITFLSGMDICVEEERDLRVSVEPQNPTAQGFELKLSTWNDSRVNSTAADWLAFGDGEAVPIPVNNNNNNNKNDDDVPGHAAKKQKNSDEKATVTKEDDECKICYENNINTVIVPCNHKTVQNELLKLGTKILSFYSNCVTTATPHMEHPLQEILVDYTITYDLQSIERLQPKRKQILMPFGLEIQGRNLLRHLLEPDTDIKNVKLYVHAPATRISKLAVQQVDHKQNLDRNILLIATFIVLLPYESISNTKAKEEARADPIVLHDDSPTGIARCSNIGTSASTATHLDRAVTQPQQKAEVNKKAKIVDNYTPSIPEEHISIPEFLTLLSAASLTSPSLNPQQHCTAQGNCSLCYEPSVPVVNVGCNCNLCIYCALFRAQIVPEPGRFVCPCRKNTLPFSQWRGVSETMKQSIRQFAKKVQTDPYVHSEYNDFVDILSH